MDACQKHLMQPWMKAVGGRGRGRVGVGALLSYMLVFLCCVRGAFGVRLLPYSSMGRAAEERRGFD